MLQAQSTIQQARTLLDGTIRLTVDLDQELSAEEMAILFKLARKSGWFLFDEAEIQDIVLPEMKMVKGKESPSRRLRSRMFVYYQETHGTEEGFDDWYEKSLDQIGQSYLDKLS